MPAFDITQPDQTVKHGLGRDILVQAWQNGYIIQAPVAQKNEDELRVFAAGVSEQNPIRLLVLKVEVGDPPKELPHPDEIKPISQDVFIKETDKPKKKVKSSATKKSTGKSGTKDS